jgi:alpha-galactosidase
VQSSAPDKITLNMNRRSFLLTTGMAAGTASVRGQSGAMHLPEILRSPDAVAVYTEKLRVRLKLAGARWTGEGIEVVAEPRTSPQGGELPITLAAARDAVMRIGLRWNGPVPASWRFLGDHWERSYGDLEWRGIVPYRLMPWYFLASDGRTTQGCGVKTGCKSIACWQVDSAGITLWLDVANGGAGVELGERKLEAAIVVVHSSASGETPLATARAFCRRMCAKPRLPSAPVYGGNNWYYTYGQNLSAEALVRDSDLMAALAPSGPNRPFMVLDMGWEPAGQGAGPTERGNDKFPDMPGMVAEMKKRGVRPGVWIRPLLSVAALPQSWLLKSEQAGGGVKPPFVVLDPSVPESLAYVEQRVRGLSDWGFDLIKHDYSTFDITGRWGFQMGPELTAAGWHFADRGKTTAEIVGGLYQAIRRGARESQLIGCNTIGHLGAGLFEMQRIGDDTSGREWPRTRKMGVNTLAFRLAQHNTFFAADADCVPLTQAIPWELTRQWLDLVTRSATPLFVSADPAVIGKLERDALKAAFALASRPQHGLEPADWLGTTVPEHWRNGGGETVDYHWYDDEV